MGRESTPEWKAIVSDNINSPPRGLTIIWPTLNGSQNSPNAPEPNHAMYKISRPAEHTATVIPVANIRSSVQLFPDPEFGPIAPRDWTSQNVLERCKKFYIQN
ncbi:hypothetical protein B0H13DRAFT_1850529 [Mycena leptocephala]|nr:hypothetical protein B0H13DRAFT_1850529 [Mycena leptocephala]